MNQGDNDRALNAIAKLLRDHRVLVFMGAGVSIDAGMPTSEQLAQRICEKATLPIREITLDRAAEAFIGSYGSKSQLDAIVSDYLSEAQRTADKTPFELFAKLPPIPHIVTTNFDTLVEDSREVRDLHVIINTVDLQVARSSEQKKPFLYKIYGGVGRPPLCLTDKEIADRFKHSDQAIFRALLDLASQSTLLFLGFRARDRNCLDWLSLLKEEHALSCTDTRIFYVHPDISESDRGRFSQFARFESIPMPARAFIENLHLRIEALRRESPRVGLGLSEKQRRVLPHTNNPFLLYKTDKILDDQDVVALFYDHAPLTNKITTPGSTVIIGGRGTGKSMLLRAFTTKGRLSSISSEKDLTALAVYMKLGADFTHSTKKYSDEDAERWASYYQHYLNLFVGEQIFSALAGCQQRFPIALTKVQIRDICDILGLKTDEPLPKDFHELSLRATLNRSTIARARIEKTKCTGSTTIEDLFSYLQGILSPKFNEGLVLLIDDFEGDALQFQPIARWIHTRKIDVKVACQHFYFIDADTGFLEKSEDYTLVDLDRYFLLGGKGGPYPSYVEAITNKRLEEFGVGASIKSLFKPRPEGYKSYAGFDALVALSSGQASKFIEICKDILVSAQGSVDISKELLDQEISGEIQRNIVLDHSHVFLESTAGDAKVGRDVEAFLSAWAEYCRQRALVVTGTQRTLRFVIRDPENLGEREATAIEHCVRRGLLQRVAPRTPHSPTVVVPMRPYRLHRLLCPRFRLELHDHHQRELWAADIGLALESKEKFVQKLLGRSKARASLLNGETEIPEDERV